MYTSIQKNWWNISFVEKESSKLIIPQAMCFEVAKVLQWLWSRNPTTTYYVWEHDGLGCS